MPLAVRLRALVAYLAPAFLIIGLILIFLQYVGNISVTGWFAGLGNIPFLLLLGGAIGMTLALPGSRGWRRAGYALAAVVLWGLVLPSISAWWGTTPFAGYVAGETVVTLPAEPCVGRPCTIPVGIVEQTINPGGYNIYWHVLAGRVILSGPTKSKNIGPEPSTIEDGVIYTTARAQGATASLQYILCPNRKFDMSQEDCT